MTSLRGEEQWVAACIRAEIDGVEVKQHDDGSSPGMHDLDIVRDDSRFAAVEVTAAADSDSIELWKLIYRPGQRWIEPSLSGGWTVGVLPSARAKRLRAELPTLLAELERRGLQSIPRWGALRRRFPAWLDDLGVVTAHQGPTAFPGSIYINIDLPAERSGGWVADTGDALAEWIDKWVSAPHQHDNREKLHQSSAGERHLFVIIPAFTTAPFSVVDLLIRDGAPFPTRDPSLPGEITHVWLMSTWDSGDGMRWSPDRGWSRFRKFAECEDGQ